MARLANPNPNPDPDPDPNPNPDPDHRCRALSPEAPREAVSLKHLSNTKLAAALVMQSALAPCVTYATWTWSSHLRLYIHYIAYPSHACHSHVQAA